MPNPADRLADLNNRIGRACLAAGRPADSVRTVAVSKKKPVETIMELHSAGQADFGENYYAEAVKKIRQLPSEGLTWHFVGSVQSRAARHIAGEFDWVHSVERIKVAERLDRGREGAGRPLNVCIQVNTSGEKSKSGVGPAEAAILAKEIGRFDNLRLRGLMSMPEPTADAEKQREAFRKLAELRAQIANGGIEMDTLSMGMSGDFEAAIAEGATIIRIGTLLFGPRETA